MVRQLEVTVNEFRAICGDSDEDSENIDGDNSDIDLEGIEGDAEENDEEGNHQTGSESADCNKDLEEVWWTAELHDIDVNLPYLFGYKPRDFYTN